MPMSMTATVFFTSAISGVVLVNAYANAGACATPQPANTWLQIPRIAVAGFEVADIDATPDPMPIHGHVAMTARPFEFPELDWSL